MAGSNQYKTLPAEDPFYQLPQLAVLDLHENAVPEIPEASKNYKFYVIEQFSYVDEEPLFSGLTEQFAQSDSGSIGLHAVLVQTLFGRKFVEIPP